MDVQPLNRLSIRNCFQATILLAVLISGGAILMANLFRTPRRKQDENRGYSMSQYMEARDELIKTDSNRALGAKLSLNDMEKKLDKILLKDKKDIIEKSMKDRTEYVPPILKFSRYKTWMEQTTTFKIIRKMPKGAALHVHMPAITSLKWFVKNITYRDDVYWCIDKESNLPMFNTRVGISQTDSYSCEWRPIKESRAAASSVSAFDEELHKGLSMLATDQLIAYTNTDQVWKRFEKYFAQVNPLLNHISVRRDYTRQALKEFRDDNVQYVEIRDRLRKYTSPDGTVGDAFWKQVMDEFVADHTDFIGGGIIKATMKYKSLADITEEIKTAANLRQQFPDFFLGYDLVGREDEHTPLISYLPALLQPTEKMVGSLPFFFHAGETNSHGTVADYNLVDALILNATRIGHGYTLGKHPTLAAEVKRRGIGVEVNPISNQLLGLVADLRNHAMVPLLADDFPLVISSDDPAVWESLPLTHDMFVAFIEMSSLNVGLGFLKQLAINSIKYSAMSDSKKNQTMDLWQRKWNTFVLEAVAEFS